MRPEQFPSWRIEEGDASKVETQAPRPLGRSLAARSNTGFRDSRKVEQRHPAFKRYAPSNLPAGNGEPSTVTASDAMHWNLAFAGLMLYAFVEYSRLPEMYPVFQILQLGKTTIL